MKLIRSKIIYFISIRFGNNLLLQFIKILLYQLLSLVDYFQCDFIKFFNFTILDIS